jgi:hypothetical protein
VTVTRRRIPDTACYLVVAVAAELLLFAIAGVMGRDNAMLAFAPLRPLSQLLRPASADVVQAFTSLERPSVAVRVPKRPALRLPSPGSAAATPTRSSRAPVGAKAAAAAPGTSPATSAGGAQSSTTRTGPSLAPVADGSCGVCRIVQDASGALHATVGGASSVSDSAYGLMDFGGPRGLTGLVVTHDRLSLGAGQVPSANLQVLQVLDVDNRVVYRLYVGAGDRVLHIQSPPGGLSSGGLEVSTRAVVPNDGKASVLVEVSAQANASLAVYVNGASAVQLTDLDGGSATRQRFLAAGIIAVDEGSGDSGSFVTPVTVTHESLAVTTATDDSGAQTAPGTLTLSPGAGANAVAPSAISAPSLSGIPIAGSTLTADPGVWSDAAATLEIGWGRCDAGGASCAPIDGAVGPTYTLAAADVGSTIRARVTAKTAAGSGLAFSAVTATVAPVPLAPVLTTAATIAGDAVEGGTLTGDPGSWTGADNGLAYAWQRCDAAGANCTPIDGAAGRTLPLGSAFVGSTALFIVTATGPGGSTTTTALSATVAAAPAPPQAQVPSNETTPVLRGDASPGSTLTATSGSWSDQAATITYAWQRCDANGSCSTIDGATQSSYTITADDIDSTLRVVVTATNAAGSASANSDSSAVVHAAAAAADPPAPAPAPEADPSPPAPTAAADGTPTALEPAPATPPEPQTADQTPANPDTPAS